MNKRLISIRELSELTGLSISTLYSWVSQKRIPYIKCGRLTRFDTKKIEQWIEKHSINPEDFGYN